MKINNSIEYGDFLRRFVAFVIDRVLLGVLLSIIFFRDIDMDMWDIDNLFSIKTLGIEAVMLLYFVYFEAISPLQATLGKKLMDLKVVSTQYQREEPGQAIIRYMMKYVSMFVFFLGFITIIFDSKKQGWHDKVAGTLVIKN